MTWLLPSRRASATPRVQSYSAARVVIARDPVGDSFGRMVGIDYPDDRNRQLGRFGHRDLLITNVDDEKRVGQRVHFLDAAEAPSKLLHLSLQRQCLALAQDRKSTRLNSSHHRLSYAVFC